MTKILYYYQLLLDSFPFCETYFTTLPRFATTRFVEDGPGMDIGM